MDRVVEWFDKNGDTLVQIFAFGVAIVLAVGLMSLQFILK